MKVLHIINNLHGGGRERRMAQTAKALKEAGVEQVIITLHDEDVYQEVNDAQIIVKKINGNRRERINKYSDMLSSFKPDIVHLWIDTPTEALFFSYAKKNYHYKLVLGFVADGNPIKGINTYHLGVQYAFRRADMIVSNSMAGLVAKKAPLNKSRVIYNGFDPRRFRPIDRGLIRSSLGVQSETLVVMCASMTRGKDWQSFFETAQLAWDKQLNATFVCIGGGELLEQHKERVASMGNKNIVFLGKRNDVEDILQAADVSMLFTNNEFHAEGVSNSIMEAMAAGLPVIATEGGGTGEIIEDKKNGFIIKPKDSQQATEILAMIINKPEAAEEVGAMAKETILRKFNIEDKTQEYLDLYKSLVH